MTASMERIRSAWDSGFEIRAVGQDGVPAALLILREASQWLGSRGLRWSEVELTDLTRHSAAGALVLGFAGDDPVACMLLQQSDPIFWPRATPGTALYVHKLAVKRAHAGRGRGARMIGWAKSEARRQGIKRLRLDTWADSRLEELYASHGFCFVDRIKTKDGVAMCRMEYAGAGHSDPVFDPLSLL